MNWKQRIVRAFFRFFILKLIARVEIRGYENLPKEGAYILAANHLGRLDGMLLYCALDRWDFIVPVAEKYKEHWLFHFLGGIMGVVWINRFDADFHALREIMQRMERGEILVIAPEGTRSPTGALQEGKPGAAYLASRTGYPIVPAVFTGTEDKNVVWHLKHFKRVQIIVTGGAPFTLAPIKGKDREQKLQAYTDEIMCRLAALLPETYRGVYADHPRAVAILNGDAPAKVG
jgi:1-acyl-sn-glycerol-3-phosphate acyltransferase